MKGYKRLEREWNEHGKGKAFAIFVFISFLCFVLGWVIGAAQTTAFIATIGYKIIKQAGYEENLDQLVKICAFEYGRLGLEYINFSTTDEIPN